ncbi:AbrB/MazE/SpoVT family DNA-binding domain-containing protein [Geomesophilobacter sediminis]|uniref:AbrB/MazE/SpoVT family DNA-binding domain-containing protein n=1 Tax=Geomesophilobacter sediminis TaxID=2798584 RepID=A0A8J7M259_9BACT|nr:AbrB/MazE/SpoVT family DNA-binding domain-containing protein [Geomesophilobacter sediminis]MBJ6727198.1 AbrB/MazE/SpoVT family DNA-binding domain-containing protein [Geomesophilobacter sediminis]
MKANIIRIGNSQGIRIPKVLLDQSQLGPEVELEVQEDRIIIRPLTRSREGWAEKFKLMAAQGDDALFDAPGGEQTDFDQDDWQW